MQGLVSLHNLARANARRCGSARIPKTGALIWNCKLAHAAQGHAYDLADRQFLSHTGVDGSDVSARARAAGYRVSYLAENIGQGYDSSDLIMVRWLDSPRHCRNIMKAEYVDIGAAKVDGFWVVMLGRER